MLYAAVGSGLVYWGHVATPKPLMPLEVTRQDPQRLLARHLHSLFLIERAFSDPLTVSSAPLAPRARHRRRRARTGHRPG
jgi:hypothetical protein